ncbi:probable beta-hexosaminidase fdl [Agrilus planipennis]|uniref:Beta-hexosaminidase n=1 Tax=Agrilus planipennis TaxID=224129 RepID=A0A1W4W7Q3_AGRPL|nr:probable beta-hexosaminidase fdl [Agrilus planipennis]XP_018320121.1 probable beta-hexosaminidase fdl [Agrilus planipennis]
MDITKNYYHKIPALIGTFLIFCGLLVFITTKPSTVQIKLGSNNDEQEPESEYLSQNSALKWSYKCDGEKCQKVLENNSTSSYITCSMTCGKNSQLWPVPQEIGSLSKQYVSFLPTEIDFSTNAMNLSKKLVDEAFEIFKRNIHVPDKQLIGSYNVRLSLNIQITDFSMTTITLSTDESYHLLVSQKKEKVVVAITAENFFGARHGLETLSQLIWYDKDTKSLNILNEADIHDYPKFKHRGVMVDTGRNYFAVEGLKRVITGMAANKLNTFHWHITDSQSFPFVVPSVPKLSQYGAYSQAKVYDAATIRDMVEYARVRGVKVIIEVDSPSHVQFGWNWGPEEDLGDLTLDCGSNTIDRMLNPFNINSLDILEKIYKEIGNLQTSTEIFHIGGDEIDSSCWFRYSNETYGEFWTKYLWLMVNRSYQANSDKPPKYVVIWNSDLTEDDFLFNYLPKESTVVQFWFGTIDFLIIERYKIIFSTVGKWYLDCGFGKWRESKGEACDPYTQWQIVYGYQPWVEYTMDIDTVLGGEVCLWTEQVGEDTLDTRLWPRTAAFAERIWSDPSHYGGRISIDVYLRLSTQRERLVQRGLKAEVLWPERCVQNPEFCT